MPVRTSTRRITSYNVCYTKLLRPDDPDLMAEPTDRASGPVPLAATDAYESQPSVSRDGRWLAYYSDESGVGQVYVQAFPGNNFV